MQEFLLTSVFDIENLFNKSINIPVYTDVVLIQQRTARIYGSNHRVFFFLAVVDSISL